MADRLKIEPDLDFIQRVQAAGGEDLKKCYQCATCSVTCELSPTEKPFPRKEMLWAQWGLKDRLMRDPDVWLCHQCNDCSAKCPRGARPGDVLAAIRDFVYSDFAFPSFMGKAVANPKALPMLFLIPMIILVALIGVNMQANGYDLGYFLTSERALLTTFIPSGYMEMLFIGGNIIIFIIAFTGLKRFWDSLEHNGVGEAKIGFMPAFLATMGELATHKNFGSCEQNKPRKIAHILVLYGFVGALIATAFSFVFGVIFGHWYKMPFGIPTPIDFWTYSNAFHILIGVITKVSGGVGGVLIVIGTIMMLRNRATNPDDVGADGYPDRFFLQLIFWVGLTGMLSWLLRLLGMGMGGSAIVNVVAYLSYFVHITTVFVLLWYMPYSKFAHMLYRTMALVWARQRGRILLSGNAVPEATPEPVEVTETAA